MAYKTFHKKKKSFGKRKTNGTNSNGEQVIRVRTPKGKQVLGLVDVRLGYGKSRVRCADGKVRLCRVPGRLKRRLWIRPGDIVLIEPWDLEPDTKADILYCYKGAQVEWLKRKGMLKELLEKEEF